MAVRQSLEITRLAQDDTATWIQQDAPDLDPAFAIPTGFDSQRAIFTQRKPHHALQEALAHLECINGRAGSFQSSRDNLTWDHIIEKIKEAEDKYHADGRGLAGTFRIIGRKVGDYASAFKLWMQLIPDADGCGSSIRGALGIVFAAAAESARVRTVIIERFKDVPGLLLDMEYTFQVYGKDEEMLRVAADLSFALLRMLEAMIKWLTERTLGRHLKTFAVPNYVSESVEAFINDVERQKQRLERRTRFLRDRQISDTNLHVDEMSREIPAIRRSMIDVKVDSHKTLLGVQEILPRMAKSQEELRNVSIKDSARLARMEKIMKSQSQCIAEQRPSGFREIPTNLLAIDAKNGLFGVLLPVALYAEWNQGRYESSYPRLCGQSPSFIDQDGLYYAMQVDTAALESDLLSILRESETMDPLDQSGAYEAATQPKFVDRVSSGRRASIFVDADSRSGAMDRVSPFSVLSATLASTIRDVRPALVLHFFCGIHLRNDDSLRGPTGIARSFLAQLLSVASYDMSFVDSRTYVENLELHHLGQLCDAIRHLVGQLKRGRVLFLFLDGSSLYERSEWTRDLHELMFRLQSLVSDPKIPATVKLLVTNPGRSQYVSENVPMDDRIAAQAQGIQCVRIDQRPTGAQYGGEADDPNPSWRTPSIFESDSDEY